MKIIEKAGNDISIVALPSDEIRVGDYLTIDDLERNNQLVIQVYDERYLDQPGIVEDLVRDEIVKSTTEGFESDLLEINTISNLIRDIRLLKCKIRGSIIEDCFSSRIPWLPSRIKAKIRKMTILKLLHLARNYGSRKIMLGKTNDKESLDIFAESLDGRLNIITGRKESGKSHLAKLLATDLVKHGAYVFVFDLNNEYSGLSWNKDGSRNSNSERNIILYPQKSLFFSLEYLGLSSILGILTHVLDIPGASLREFIRMWNSLESQGKLTMSSLGDLIQNSRCNEFIRDALYSRFHSLLSSGLFYNDKTIRIEDFFTKMNKGGLVIISLGRVSPIVRRMIVELILGKLVELLEKKSIPPIFLFAEEAHLYLRETYWDDIVTRMRHFGIFTTFITNQPNAIGDDIFRQVDNIFLFNFNNDVDLEKLARVTMVDSETVKSMVRNLPSRSCLAIGKTVKNLPVLVNVSSTDTLTMGETRLFFPQSESPYVMSKKLE